MHTLPTPNNTNGSASLNSLIFTIDALTNPYVQEIFGSKIDINIYGNYHRNFRDRQKSYNDVS